MDNFEKFQTVINQQVYSIFLMITISKRDIKRKLALKQITYETEFLILKCFEFPLL